MNKSFLFSIFFLFLFLSFTASISACTCNCNYIPGATCGGLAGTSGCSFTTDEINQVRNYAQNNPGKAYTGMCTYSYSVGYSCYYTFSIHETVTWDGCGCDLGSGSSCGRLEDCSVCKNPTFRYSSSSCGITNTPTNTPTRTPTNTPTVTPTFTKTPTPTPTSIVTPTCNPNFTLNATPACNKENFSITNYPVVNKPISNSVKKVGGSVDAFPGCDFSNVHTTGASCDLTETVSFDWIHSYQTCTSPTNCSPTCTKTIQKLNNVPITPTCPPTLEGSCWAAPLPAHFDSNINFLGNYPGQPEQFKNISVSSDGYACGAPSTSFFNEKTTITSACGTPIPNAPNYDLGLSFNYSIPACPGLLSNTCSCNVSADPSIYPGFLQTENGDMYVKGDSPDEPSIKMSKYPTTKSLSKFTFGNPKGFIRINGANHACDTGSTFGICSTQRYILWNYEDNNIPGDDGSYFASIVSIIENNIANDDTITQTNINDSVLYANNSSILNFDLVRIKKNLIIPGGDGFLIPRFSQSNVKQINRILYDGSADSNFVIDSSNKFSSNLTDQIFDMERQGDSYIISGSFKGINSTKQYLARMKYDANSTLVIDSTFNQGGIGPDGVVRKILVDQSNKIYISSPDAGGFLNYNGIPTTKGLIRLNSNGTQDNTFNINMNSPGVNRVNDFDFDQNEKIIIGGFFKNDTPLINHIMRTNINGQIDNTFQTGSGFDQKVLFVEPIEDKYLVYGNFTQYNGQPANKLVKLNNNGTLDNTFNFPYSRINFDFSYIYSIQYSKGKIIMTGNLNFDFGNNGTYKNFPYLFFNSDGELESTYIDPSYLNSNSDNQIDSGVFNNLGDESYIIGRYTGTSSLKKINSKGKIDSVFSLTYGNYDIGQRLGNPLVLDRPNTYYCNRNTVFLIEGDLEIFPDFLNQGDSGCLFVVNGTTYVRENGDQDDDIDLIDAFIITKNFVSDKEYSDDQLIVNGGLVVGGNSSFFRNINYNPNYQSFNDTPSELLKYEGARFISKFNKILKVPTSLTIKETN